MDINEKNFEDAIQSELANAQKLGRTLSRAEAMSRAHARLFDAAVNGTPDPEPAPRPAPVTATRPGDALGDDFDRIAAVALDTDATPEDRRAALLRCAALVEERVGLRLESEASITALLRARPKPAKLATPQRPAAKPAATSSDSGPTMREAFVALTGMTPKAYGEAQKLAAKRREEEQKQRELARLRQEGEALGLHANGGAR